MTIQIIVLLLILGTAMVLFSFEWVSADVTALGVLMALILTGLLPANVAFLGFGSDSVMMILGLLILTAALMRTGVIEVAGRTILRHTGMDPNRLLMVVMVASAVLGAFMSNTASTAFFLPLVIGFARRAKISPSKLLMPLAFASILTSSVTVVSSSTNIIVSGLMTEYGLGPMGMFEMAPVGIPIAIIGVLYMYFIGRHIMPDRAAQDDGDTRFGVSQYVAEVRIHPESTWVGKTLVAAGLGRTLNVRVVRIIRAETQREVQPRSTSKLNADDILLVEGEREEILKIKDITGIDIEADAKLFDPDVENVDLSIVDVMIMAGSPLIRRTLKNLLFYERFGVRVLALDRQGQTLTSKVSELQLRLGDVLLVEGSREAIRALDDDNTFRVLGTVEDERPLLRRAPIAVAAFVGALALATVNLVSLPVAMLLGALVVFVTRCITPEEAYREVEWKALILIGSMLGLGVAMEHTGTAEFLAAQLVSLLGNLGPIYLLAAFFLLTIILTQPISNQAAAVVVLPVALQTAIQLDLNPRTFAMMIAVAASCSYITPLEPSCLMVYGPGRYRFMDFVKVGLLLTLMIFIVALILVPLIWPLNEVLVSWDKLI